MALTWLADKSALVRMRHAEVAAQLAPRLHQLVTCSVVDLEILYSARTLADLLATRAERRAIPRLDLAQADFDRAEEVMARLAATGHHRAAGLPDLLIAAVAERHGAVVLHYDRDFDVIASVTGQPTAWVVPPGTVP